LIRNFAW
jgi:hypothetical protein